MDLTGQLSNLPGPLLRLLEMRLRRSPVPQAPDRLHSSPFHRRPYERVRDAISNELVAEPEGLRVSELRRRVEAQLGETIDTKRFKDYLNGQSKAAKPLVERLSYGIYRLRQFINE